MDAKKININALTQDQLDLVAIITGAEISRHHAPIIGDYLVSRGADGKCKRIGNEPIVPACLEVAYEAPTDTQIINRIYVGSRYHGPMLSWSADGWRNLYSNGNYGHNYSHGGTWAARANRAHAMITDALAHRAEDAADCLKSEQVSYTEGAAILDALRSLEETR